MSTAIRVGLPRESRADEGEIEAYCLQYLARRWHCGDPVQDLSSAVSNYMKSYKQDPWQYDKYLSNDAPENDEETEADDDFDDWASAATSD